MERTCACTYLLNYHLHPTEWCYRRPQHSPCLRMSSPTSGEKSLLLPPPIFRMEEGLTPFGCRSPHSPNWGNESHPSPTFPTHIHPATQNKTFHRDLNSTSPSTMQMAPMKKQRKIWQERSKSSEETSLTHNFYVQLRTLFAHWWKNKLRNRKVKSPASKIGNLIWSQTASKIYVEATYSTFLVWSPCQGLSGSTEYGALKILVVVSCRAFLDKRPHGELEPGCRRMSVTDSLSIFYHMWCTHRGMEFSRTRHFSNICKSFEHFARERPFLLNCTSFY